MDYIMSSELDPYLGSSIKMDDDNKQTNSLTQAVQNKSEPEPQINQYD